MKNIFIIIFLLLSVLTFGEGISMSVNVNGTTSSNINSNVVDEIAKRLEILQNKYNSKLNNLDSKRTEKIIDEIYELLALLPEDVAVSPELIKSTSPNRTQNPDVNISFKVNDEHQKDSETKLIKQKTLITEEVDAIEAMSESEFKQLLSNVEKEGFDDDKTSVVRIAASNNHFTINQLSQLLVLFSFADNKINVVRIVYPKVVDKNNAHNLLKDFTYSDDKNAVEEIISVSE